MELPPETKAPLPTRAEGAGRVHAQQRSAASGVGHIAVPSSETVIPHSNAIFHTIPKQDPQLEIQIPQRNNIHTLHSPLGDG